MNIDAVVVSLF
jgi:hypothetical protein